MSITVHCNNRSETIKLDAAFNDYCCTFEETCKVIRKQFDLKNSLSDYHMAYYDPSYSTWVNFNIHVSSRVTDLLRYSSSNTVQIRMEHQPKNISTSFIEKDNLEKSDSQITENTRYAHMVIWLDEYIGSPLYHKQLKQMCQVMINTNDSFLQYDDIDTQIQYNSIKQNIESISRPNLKHLLETIREHSCPFQCVLSICDNMDEFLIFLNMSSKLAYSLSVVISGRFPKEVLPIIISYKQKELLPKLSFLYILCSNVQYYYDWALGYIENKSLDIDTNLELFDDEKTMFVRLLNDIRRHLTCQGDQFRSIQKENSNALQYYKAARQLFLNTLPWEDCPTLNELNHLNQLIEETHNQVVETSIDIFPPFIKDNNQNELKEKFGQQCT